MQLLFLYGLPATGKLTIGRELAALTGYKLFHNHLVLDGLLQIFPFGSQPFIDLRQQLWLSVFDHACRAGLPGLIFTFAPEPSVPATFLPETLSTLERGRGQVVFVELVCPFAELKARVSLPSRLHYEKLADPVLFEELYTAGAFHFASPPTPSLTIDTSLCTPAQAATRIVDSLRLPQPQPLRP